MIDDSSAPALPALLILSGLGLVLIGMLVRIKQWRRGKPAEVPLVSGLLALPKRYLIDLHHVVMRAPFVANMHMIAAGSLLLATILMLVVHGLWPSFALAWVICGTAVLMLVGACMVFLRRWRSSEHLSGGAYRRIPLGLFSLALFCLLSTLPLTGLAMPIDYSSSYGMGLLLAGVYGTLEIFGSMAGGPMKHAVAGALHLAFHPRPKRFAPPKLETTLLPLDLSVQKLGVETVLDFKWTQLLSFDACVQCGRCEAVCPAFAAGLPLNPKTLINDLARAQGPLIDFSYSGNPHPGKEPAKHNLEAGFLLVGPQAAISSDTIWACTTCRACVQACPMMIEHVDAVVDLRRYQSLDAGEVPGKAGEVLENLRLCDSRDGMTTTERFEWAVDLDLPLLQEKKVCDILLWLGGSALELSGQRTLRAMVALLRRASVDFAVLGEEELDSGDTARRLGEEAIFQRLARTNIGTLKKYRFNLIVTADPHDLHVLKNEYIDLGGQYSVLHHSEFLLALIKDGRLAVKPPALGPTTFHDPCYLARYNGITEAPRQLLQKIGIDYVEMAQARTDTFCCGGGGAAPITDISGKRRIPDIRIEQARSTEAKSITVACPGCMTMLTGVTHGLPTQDIAELVQCAAEAAD